MKQNMGTTDRVIRTIIACITGILIYTQVLTGTTAIVAGVLAGIFALTSFLSFCPLYLPFGINTRKKKDAH